MLKVDLLSRQEATLAAQRADLESHLRTSKNALEDKQRDAERLQEHLQQVLLLSTASIVYMIYIIPNPECKLPSWCAFITKSISCKLRCHSRNNGSCHDILKLKEFILSGDSQIYSKTLVTCTINPSNFSFTKLEAQSSWVAPNNPSYLVFHKIESTVFSGIANNTSYLSSSKLKQTLLAGIKNSFSLLFHQNNVKSCQGWHTETFYFCFSVVQRWQLPVTMLGGFLWLLTFFDLSLLLICLVAYYTPFFLYVSTMF